MNSKVSAGIYGSKVNIAPFSVSIYSKACRLITSGHFSLVSISAKKDDNDDELGITTHQRIN